MQDILLDENYDLSITPTGDFAVGFSDEQHIDLILESGKGDWRQNPQVGVNIRQLLAEDQTPTFLKHEIQKQLEVDGARVERIDFLNGKLQIKAKYE